MKRMLRGLALATTLSAGIGPVAAAEAPGLAEMIGLLPDAAAVYEASPIFSYLDMRALERASGAPTPESEAAFDALPREQQGLWVDATYRMAMGPQWLSDYFASRGPGPDGMAATVGFDMFAIDRSMGFGTPPGDVLVLAGDEGLADPARLEAALEPRGFALRQIGGVPVWHRYDDFSMDLRQRSMGDPFGGRLGRAARIAVLPRMLVGTAGWPMLEAVVAAPRTQRRGGGAFATMLRAAVAAAEDFAGPGALLIQAQAMPLSATVETPPMPQLASLPDAEAVFAALKEQLAAASAGPSLPPYPLSLMADFQVGAEQVNLFVLPYADAATATAAAEILAGRLRAWAVPGREADGPLASRAGGTVETKVVRTEGVASAVVAVRYPLPDAAAEDAARPGAILRMWLQAIYRRDFKPLALVN